MKPIDYLVSIGALALCAGAGKALFLVFGVSLEPVWTFPLSLLQYVVYGAFPIALIAVLIVKIVTRQWIWRIKRNQSA